MAVSVIQYQSAVRLSRNANSLDRSNRQMSNSDFREAVKHFYKSRARLCYTIQYIIIN